MAKKRITPQDEFDRFADNLWNAYEDEIEDIDSYNDAFDKFMEVDKKPLEGNQDTVLREEGFKILSSKHKSVIKEHLPLDIVHRKKEKVTELREKKKLRKEERFIGIVTKKPQFIFVRYINIKHPKGEEKIGFKVVYTREIKFKMRGKDTSRFIDRYGRFTSKIKEQ